jgi:ketosteroid isomerase-like protein
VIDTGSSVVVITHNTGSRKSGIKLSVRVAHTLTFRDSKISRYEYFVEDLGEARRAVEIPE